MCVSLFHNSTRVPGVLLSKYRRCVCVCRGFNHTPENISKESRQFKPRLYKFRTIDRFGGEFSFRSAVCEPGTIPQLYSGGNMSNIIPYLWLQLLSKYPRSFWLQINSQWIWASVCFASSQCSFIIIECIGWNPIMITMMIFVIGIKLEPFYVIHASRCDSSAYTLRANEDLPTLLDN